MKVISISPVVSAFLTPLLAVWPLLGQTPTDSPAAAQSFEIHLATNGVTQATAGSRTEKGFAIQVTDSNGAAIQDAAVLFRMPDSGATGAFRDGSHAAVVYTDKSGRAEVSGIQWSETAGIAAVRVTATKGESHAGMVIEETIVSGTGAAVASSGSMAAAPAPGQPATPQNIVRTGASPDTPAALPVTAQSAPPSVSVSNTPKDEAPHTSSHTKWIILALVAAGAGAGVALAGKGKSSSAATQAPGLSIGSPTISVGGGH